VTHVGLTGGIGSGKSAVARLLAARGAVVIDADAIARQVVEPGTDGLEAVIAEFGDDVRAADGSLDRGGLAAQVFTSTVSLARLEAIVHPLVRARRAELLAQSPQDAVVVEDVPLLVEKGMAGDFDLVVVVTAPVDVRVERLTSRRGLDAEDVRNRIAAQATDEQRAAVADVIIDNSGAPGDLEAQVDELWERVSAERR
jgi:dephospho-CoA kinase